MGLKHFLFILPKQQVKKWTFSLTLVLVFAVDPQRRKHFCSVLLTESIYSRKNNVFWPKLAAVATSCDSPLAPALSLLHYFRGSFKELRGKPRRGWLRNNLLHSIEKLLGL